MGMRVEATQIGLAHSPIGSPSSPQYSLSGSQISLFSSLNGTRSSSGTSSRTDSISPERYGWPA